MNNRGSVEIIVVFSMLAILAASALVLDYGSVALNRIRLQNALENAAVSGAHFLTVSELSARTTALNYFSANGEDPLQAVVTISPDLRRLDITSTKQVDFTIARVFGFTNKAVSAKATAIIGPLQSISNGVRPLGVEQLSYNYGDSIVLKEDAGSGVYGNYGSISLGGPGNSIYTHNLLYGYNGTVSFGDVIPTEPGDKASAVNQLKNYLQSYPETFNNYSSNSARLWVLPLVESYDPNGRADVTVVGFAKFFIEDIKNKAGQGEITGRFVEYVDLGDINPNLEITGLYGVKLIR